MLTSGLGIQAVKTTFEGLCIECEHLWGTAIYLWI